MFDFRFLRVGLAGALAFASALAMSNPVQRADTNGDQSVDVLDLQTVIAQVLKGNANEKADANGDGCVDVRDFQFILDQVQEPGPAEETPPRPDQTGIILSSQPDVPIARTAVARLGLSEIVAPPAPVCNTDVGRYDPEAPPKAIGSTLKLTPHAPPAQA